MYVEYAIMTAVQEPKQRVTAGEATVSRLMFADDFRRDVGNSRMIAKKYLGRR